MSGQPLDPRFPNLFIIGAPKCGTTLVHNALAAVPDVFMTTVKEPGFFSTDRHFRRGVPHYLDSFFGGAQLFTVRGESTPWYLYSAEARLRIKDVLSDAHGRFVVLIRQPSDRAYSMYLDQKRGGLEPRSFEQAVTEELELSLTDLASGTPHRRYLWTSRYATHIRTWRTTFGEASVRVFLTDDLHDPQRFWNEMSSFLGADLGGERLTDRPRGQTNAATGRRWPWADRILRSIYGRNGFVISRARKAIPVNWYRRAAQSVWTWNQTDAPPTPPPVEILSMLDEEFRSEILALQSLLSRSFAHWLPENIRRD